MKRIAQLTIVAVLLSAFNESCFAAPLIRRMTKQRAEKELGVVMKRAFLGFGSVTNEAGISIEFAPKGRLEGFLFVTLDVYSELPAENEYGLGVASVTLQPVIQTEEKVRVFFTVDPQYLNRTEITIRVRSDDRDVLSLKGYGIRFNSADFPRPQPNRQLSDARTLYEMGKLDVAEKRLLGVLQAEPENPAAAYLLDLVREAQYRERPREYYPTIPPQPIYR
jgi:hypothetical protein